MGLRNVVLPTSVQVRFKNLLALQWKFIWSRRFRPCKIRGRIMKILGKLLTLRAIEEEDLPRLHKWANDPVTQDGIGEIHFPSSMRFHRNWFETLRTDSLNQRFIAEIPGGAIGVSSIVNIDWRNRHAWHGLVLGDSSHRGKGYG